MSYSTKYTLKEKVLVQEIHSLQKRKNYLRHEYLEADVLETILKHKLIGKYGLTKKERKKYQRELNKQK